MTETAKQLTIYDAGLKKPARILAYPERYCPVCLYLFTHASTCTVCGESTVGPKFGEKIECPELRG